MVWSSGNTLTPSTLNNTIPSWANTSTGTTAIGYVNVRDYGAVGDGVTNDSTAVANAITAGAGRQVFFPAGTYLLNTGLSFGSSGTWLTGAGRAATVLQFTGNSGVAVTISGAGIRGAGIERMRINCSGAGSTAIKCLANFGHVQLIDLQLSPSATGAGVDLSAGNSVSTYLREVRVGSGNIGFNFDASNNTANNTITAVNCYAQLCTTYGFTVANTPACTLDGCSADTNGTGFSLGYGVALIGCTAEGNTVRGYEALGGGNYSFINCFTSSQDQPWVIASSAARVIWVNPRTDSTPSTASSIRIVSIGEGVIINTGGLDAGLDPTVATALPVQLGGSIYASSGTILGTILGAGSGSAVAPSQMFSSEVSLGLFRSATSTIAVSYGKFDFRNAGLILSSGTTAQSASTAKVADGQLIPSVLSLTTNGAALYFRSGNSTYVWPSSGVIG